MIEFNSIQYQKVTWSLALGSFLVFCNLYVFQPILPQMANHFSVSETQINWLFAISTLALSVFLVPWAITSETLGRRTVILIGLWAMPIIGTVMLVSDELWTLILLRGLMGIALAAFAAVAVAYMVEELSQKAFMQAIGGYIAANSLGGITGRVLGGVISDFYSWQTAVAVIAVLTFAGCIFVTLLLPKQRHFVPTSGLFFHHNRALIHHLNNPIVWCAMLIGGVNFALFVNLYSVMGFRLVSQPHYLPVSLSALIFLCYLAGTVSSKFSGTWNKHYSPIAGMITGITISFLGMLISAIESIPAMIFGLLLISAGAFFAHTLAYAWVSQKVTHAKATATALYLVHYYVGGSLGGFFLLYCWQLGRWPYVVYGASLLYALLYFLCWKLNRYQSHQRCAVQAKMI
ncbi:MFS transporter [Vibrio sp. ZSDZ34]|uniref:MFS transporter n=1 Tax=Vibrio gelatinilyticus TaxID=2893468 RepID=A0A9X1W8X3_9VIBR|nr:MFS transporter [Vibrio gelatinilyticus]MCJ2376447.1 MFS transporter [Vibrio gelatinilyticus]